jgi:CAAX prenyl protease-like protein
LHSVVALFFAATIHSSIVLLSALCRFRWQRFGEVLIFLHSLAAVQVGASRSPRRRRGFAKRPGFRGCIQRPIEQRHGAPAAILISSPFFTALHLTKAWATPGIIAIVFGAGMLPGLLACSSGSLIPGIIGHAVMHIGLFAYWWTSLAGEFTMHPVTETGVDPALLSTVRCTMRSTAR